MKRILAALEAGDLEAARQAVANLNEVTRNLADLDPAQVSHLTRLLDLGHSAAEMVHEMRQPLVAVKSYAQMIQFEPGLDAKTVERAATIAEYADRCEGFLERLSRYSRGEPVSDDPEPSSLDDAVEAAIQMLRLRTKANITLQHNLAPDLPPVLIDGTSLQQVLVNLLGNACQALGEAGGCITIRTALEDELVTTYVSDDGPGVAAEARHRLFQPFATTKQSGTGLGLHISRQIAERAGGTLDLLDSPEGALFRLSLPAATA